MPPPQALNVYIGRRILELRTAHRLSQQKLGERSGVHASWIGKLERAEAGDPGVQHLSQIADALGVGLVDLFPPKGAAA